MKQFVFFLLIFLLSFFLLWGAFYYHIPYRNFYFFIFYFLFVYLTIYFPFKRLFPALLAVSFFHLATLTYFETPVLEKVLFWFFQYVIFIYFIYFSSEYNRIKNENLTLSFKISVLERLGRDYFRQVPLEHSMKILADLIKDLLINITGVYFHLKVSGEDKFIFEYQNFPDSPAQERIFYNEVVDFIENLPEKKELLVIEKVDEKYSYLYREKSIVYIPIIADKNKAPVGEILVFSRAGFSYQEVDLLAEFFAELLFLFEGLKYFDENNSAG